MVFGARQREADTVSAEIKGDAEQIVPAERPAAAAPA